MQTRLPGFVAAVALLAGLGVAACGQEAGERCEIRSDCQDGLMCDIVPPSRDGVCVSPNARKPVEEPRFDGGRDAAAPVVVDAAPKDTALVPVDAPNSSDAAVVSPDGPAPTLPDAAPDSSAVRDGSNAD